MGAIQIKKKLKLFLKGNDCILWLFTAIAAIYSLLLISSLQRSGNYNYMISQVSAIAVGFALALLLSRLNYEYFVKYWWIFAAAGVAMTMIVFIFGIQVEGTDDTAWIRLPGGFTIQPSEFVKICFIITFTKHLAVLKEKQYLNKLWAVTTLFIHGMIPIAIIHIQGDDGTVLIFAFVMLVMAFAAGVPGKYFAILGVGAAVSVPLLWNFVLNDEHRNRITALFDLDKNSMNTYGWQQYQGKVSIASGQLSGSGLYNGQRVEYGIVPEQQNDFILTVAGEELGFIGCIIVLAVLFIIIYRVIADGRKTSDFTGTMLCTGIFATIASQSIINIGMVLGVIPVIGITLPFFSAGGSSVLSMLICVGIVQSVVRHSEFEPEKISVKIGKKDRVKI